jgi:hypothetical protein
VCTTGSLASATYLWDLFVRRNWNFGDAASYRNIGDRNIYPPQPVMPAIHMFRGFADRKLHLFVLHLFETGMSVFHYGFSALLILKDFRAGA